MNYLSIRLIASEITLTFSLSSYICIYSTWFRLFKSNIANVEQFHLVEKGLPYHETIEYESFLPFEEEINIMLIQSLFHAGTLLSLE